VLKYPRTYLESVQGIEKDDEIENHANQLDDAPIADEGHRGTPQTMEHKKPIPAKNSFKFDKVQIPLYLVINEETMVDKNIELLL
jgi:hypothetical protein